MQPYGFADLIGWYKPTGERIYDPQEIDRLLVSIADRRVASTYVETPVHDEPLWVSTVFLVLDHSYLAGGPPILWETMPFGGVLDQEAFRYISLDDAIKGHQDVVSLMLMELDATNIPVTKIWGHEGKAALGKHPTVQWIDPHGHEPVPVSYLGPGEYTEPDWHVDVPD